MSNRALASSFGEKSIGKKTFSGKLIILSRASLAVFPPTKIESYSLAKFSITGNLVLILAPPIMATAGFCGLYFTIFKFSTSLANSLPAHFSRQNSGNFVKEA